MKRYLRFGRIADYLCNAALLVGMVAGLNGVMKAQTDTGRVEGILFRMSSIICSRTLTSCPANCAERE
jgi:hypothetical protein